MGQSFSDISLYHEYRSARETEHLVSQKTWDDLNLDDFSNGLTVLLLVWADSTSTTCCITTVFRRFRNKRR